MSELIIKMVLTIMIVEILLSLIIFTKNSHCDCYNNENKKES